MTMPTMETLSLAPYVTGLAGIAVLTSAWVAVQRAWQRTFPEVFEDPDGLAGRASCHGCAAEDDCDTARRVAEEDGS